DAAGERGPTARRVAMGRDRRSEGMGADDRMARRARRALAEARAGDAMRRMRVGLVHPFSWPEVRRGGERYLDDLAWYLASAGHDVTVITGTNGEPGEGEVHGARVRKLRHRVPGPLARRRVAAVET